MDRPKGRETAKLAAITAAWILLTKGLVWFGEHAVPDAVKAKIALQTFLMACQIVTVVVGVGLSFALLDRPRAALALGRPRARQLVATALLAPAFLVATTVIALQAALPTLLEEMRTRGAGASRQNAGEFGRMLEQGPLLATLLWGAILAAATEELLFRGALWSLVNRLITHARAAAKADPPPSAPRSGAAIPGRGAEDALLGLVPTVVAAAVFGLMHGEIHGGVGIVRLVSATLLGLGAGVLRRWTGSVAAPILLHFLNNTMVIAHGRKWFGVDAPGTAILDGVPNSLLGIAAAGLVGAGISWAAVMVGDRRIAREKALAEGAGS